ncbi:hypothetical protein BJP78_26200 (plasmid) [Mycobacterium avium subsp. hominissuis]|uniref:ESX-1 secretion-associated protein n=1 Tax=Mycobacterium avium subsp. hominissuis TaxID=439334 RepID=A0A2A3LDH3_MYCAV|nr:hypothetical protein [Mycobacterium avium]MBZ4631623.1 hypothetical protein [Mycobacterium avium subsp. hominissuis]PBJ39052.1 hypothetical protein XV03_04150 [Mycobacterium avium subsp. hominissuis]QWY65215.1 hypothetical protein BJP78_26200 [Mycobacterium avium subsp. hominissuis]
MSTSDSPGLAGRSGTIQANPDVLRAVAASLHGVAEDIESLLPEIKDLHDTTAREAADHTVSGGPAPYFSPLLDALHTANGKVLKNVEQARDNVRRDAEALQGLADSFESNEQTHASKIANL